MIVERFAALGRAAIVELVPKDDPKVRHLLRTREDVFPDYTLDAFEAALGTVFTIREREPLPGSSRVLFLAERPS
jgi:hypothetical protein